MFLFMLVIVSKPCFCWCRMLNIFCHKGETWLVFEQEHPILNFFGSPHSLTKKKKSPLSLVYELCIDKSSSQNKKQITNLVKSFKATLRHMLDSYHVSTMFQIFLTSVLVSRKMFLSSYIIGI
jgi:hypothetical protein